MSEEPETGNPAESGKGQMEEKGKEEQTPKETARPGRVKHERLKQERMQEAKHKEKEKGFLKTLVQKWKHLFDRKRKDKFLGGTKGRRGG